MAVYNHVWDMYSYVCRFLCLCLYWIKSNHYMTVTLRTRPDRGAGQKDRSSGDENAKRRNDLNRVHECLVLVSE